MSSPPMSLDEIDSHISRFQSDEKDLRAEGAKEFGIIDRFNSLENGDFLYDSAYRYLCGSTHASYETVERRHVAKSEDGQISITAKPKEGIDTREFIYEGVSVLVETAVSEVFSFLGITAALSETIAE